MLKTWIFLILPLAATAHPYQTEPQGNKVKQQGIEPPQAFKDINNQYRATMKSVIANRPNKGCNRKNIRVRRSWESMKTGERLDYIRAVKCLHQKQSQADPGVASGIRNRYDDFTYSHMNQSLRMHESGLFLPWHRYFVWAYEKALREECGYKGSQPYWDSARWTDNQLASPLFDGSPTSLGGNGENINQGQSVFTLPLLPATINITNSPTTGGGCVTTGPLLPWTVSLGPVTTSSTTPQRDPLGRDYNPRCLTRGFRPEDSRRALNWDNFLRLLRAQNIAEFRPVLMEGRDPGIHVPHHTALGGDVDDIFSSPNDPAFYFLHAQIDRLWSLWQGLDWQGRRDALNGTGTFQNLPPTPEITLDSGMEMVYAGGSVRVSDGMSTVDGPFCYVYQ